MPATRPSTRTPAAVNAGPTRREHRPGRPERSGGLICRLSIPTRERANEPTEGRVTEKELVRFKRRVAADLGVVLTRTQKMLLQHLGILQEIVEDPKASPEARLSAIKSAGRTLDRLRVRQRRLYVRD